MGQRRAGAVSRSKIGVSIQLIEMLAYPVDISMSAMRLRDHHPHRGRGASGPPGRARCERRDILGHLCDRALGGERCWVRHEDGEVRPLPAHRWLAARFPDNPSCDAVDEVFDEAVTQLCTGPAIELGCGPERLVARLIQRGIPALGVDRSATAIRLAGRGGAPALLGRGNVGLGGDPRGHRYPRATGAAGIAPRGRALVSLGIGRCGLRRHAGSASGSDGDRRASDRRPRHRDPGRLVSAL